MTTGPDIKRLWSSVWKGRASLWGGVFRLAWALLLLSIAGWLWNTAVRIAALPGTFKTISLGIVVLSLAVFAWGVSRVWKALRRLGLRGVLITAAVAFSFLVFYNLLTSASGPISLRQAGSVITQSIQQVGSHVKSTFQSFTHAPEAFRFAYTGERRTDYLTGFPTPNPDVQQVIQIDASSYHPIDTAQLQPGGYAQITHPDGSSVNCRSGPGMEYLPSVTFNHNDRVLILDGPESTDQDHTWWLVHGLRGEGWCLEETLTPGD